MNIDSAKYDVTWADGFMIENNELIVVQFSLSHDTFTFPIKGVVARWGCGKLSSVVSNVVLSTRCNVTHKNCIVMGVLISNCGTESVTSCVVVRL